MSKKKRQSQSRPSQPHNGAASPQAPRGTQAGATPSAQPASAQPVGAGTRPKPVAFRAPQALPAEIGKGDWTAILLALMMFFTPALGVPHEEMLQDTLKSIIVSFVSLTAALVLFWRQRNRRDAMRWHFVMWLFLGLMAYALGSMVWSHTYLAGVEAIRWFILALVMWLGMNALSRERIPPLASGIHAGVTVACVWGALQFWFSFSYFPQGPNPASTFVNRNFLAEFIACTVPFSLYLLVRAKSLPLIALMALTFAFDLVVLMMTGTRSALVGAVAAVIATAIGLWVFRQHLPARAWDASRRIVAIGIFLATFVGLGLIPANNPKVNRVEGVSFNAFQMMLFRSAGMVDQYEYTKGSFSVRLIMWRATMTVIKNRPFSGVGAGAWEVDIPLYQAEGAQLETDYYVHNEVLHLIAEYGIVGWLFLIFLAAYLLMALWRTWRMRNEDVAREEAVLRVVALGSLLGLLLVSNAGFPWRLASTAAMFALGLAVLAASDARINARGWYLASRLPWRPAYSQAGAVVTMVCLALAAFITQRAAECEYNIVRATKLSLTISQSGDPNNPKWDRTKAEMLRLIKAGTDINPHYRKITPMVGDELARWGDWRNAVWIWESVLSSRPYIVAIMANVARGYAQMGQTDKALEYIARAKKIQPKAVSVRSLEVIMLGRSGREAEALKLARECIAEEAFDYDLVNAAWVLAARAKDAPFAIKALELRTRNWPANRVDGLMRMAGLYLAEMKNEPKAIELYKEALQTAPAAEREALRKQIPAQLQAKV